MPDLPSKPSQAVLDVQHMQTPSRRGPPRGGATRKHGRQPYRKNDNDKADNNVVADQPIEQKTEPPVAAPTKPEPVATPAAEPQQPRPKADRNKSKRPNKPRTGEKGPQLKAEEKETPVPDVVQATPQQSTSAVPVLSIQPPESVNSARSSQSTGRGGSRGGNKNAQGRNKRGNGKEKAPAQDERVSNRADDETSTSSSFSVPTPINSPSSSQHLGSHSKSKAGPSKPIIHDVDYNSWADRSVDDSVWTMAPEAALYSTHPSSGVPTPPVPTTYQLPDQPTPTPPPHHLSPNPNQRRLALTPNINQPPPNTTSQASPKPIQPPIDDSPTQIRRVGLSHVLLGPGACVQHVFTDAESPWIVISNLPRTTRKLNVQNLVQQFGQTRTIKVYDARGDTHWLPTARVLFERHEQAKEAVTGLHGLMMGKGQITVRLDMDRMDGSGYVKGLTGSTGSVAPAGPVAQSALIEHDPAAVVKSCIVKVTWFAPTASVYVTYQTSRFAFERVKELNGRTYGNRRLVMKPVFSERDPAKVARENGGYIVRIDGLWGNVNTEELGRYVRSTDIVVQPNYSSETGLTKLREDLSDVAPLESFKLLKNRRDDRKYTALAQYTTPTAAAAAVKVFEGRKGDYLGNSPIFVSRHLSIRYLIPSKLCRALQGEINRLHSWSMDDPDIHVRQNDDIHKKDYVQINISGNESKHVAAAKSQIDRALAGEPLRDRQGAKIWDPYFTSEDWASFSEKVAEETGVCVRADQRTGSMLLFGPDYARDEAGGLMRIELERLAGLRRVLDIPPPVFRRISGGGLTILRNLVGKGNIFVNVFRQSLTFYGDDEVVRRVKKALDVMYSEVGARLRRHSDCVVCLCQPEESILLHCGHHYCRSCFSQYVASAAENKTLPLVCVGRECKAHIPLSMITLHAAQPDQDALFYAAFQSYVASHPEDYRYCPTPDCQYIYRVGQPDSSIQCRLCLVHICSHCHVEHHEGISCEDYLASHSESEIQKSFDKWRNANDVKPCPHCSAPIEKIAGCNHMMCSVCRTHICWVCLAKFRTGDEVYAHMRSRHGGIGL